MIAVRLTLSCLNEDQFFNNFIFFISNQIVSYSWKTCIFKFRNKNLKRNECDVCTKTIYNSNILFNLSINIKYNKFKI